MKVPPRLAPVIRIAKYTLADEVRQKSLIVMFLICAAFVMLTRGCYQSNFTVNGQALDAETTIAVVSRIAFHGVAAAVMLLAALLSMRAFRRDRDDGMQSAILARPVARRQYVAGKLLGLWALSTVFMFVLHGMVFIVASLSLGAVAPGYLAASLLCSLNLLFVVCAALLFSLLMPDIAAFLSVLAIAVLGLVADGIFAVSHSPLGQMVMGQTGAPSAVTGWKVLYYVWPKLSGTQHFATSLIAPAGAGEIGALYPLLNVLFYVLVLGACLLWRFGHEEIT
jgi:ABC-type transport system involved in multi-copper enzyme maturation permease subunit